MILLCTIDKFYIFKLQLLSGYSELTADVQIVPREWQTIAMKEAYLRRLTEVHSDEEQEKVRI